MSTTPRPRHLAVLTTTAALAALLPLAGASAGLVAEPVRSSAPGAALRLDPVGTYETGVFDESAAEIVEYYAAAQRLLVVNAAQAKVEVLDASDPDDPDEALRPADLRRHLGRRLDRRRRGRRQLGRRPRGRPRRRRRRGGGQDRRRLARLLRRRRQTAQALGAVRLGALPDMVTITPDGTRAVVANEGEPAEDYSVDPEGTVSVVALPDSRRGGRAVGRTQRRLPRLRGRRAAQRHPRVRRPRRRRHRQRRPTRSRRTSSRSTSRSTSSRRRPT